ncbi:MAG TPA: NEW3 domain-containing protein [Syntrophorhabdaceae bacterium]|nr:NEW3 domain-containing protein [Syntrophorhabdaceae bacterium]HPP06720.1 NEW3 domain-containing protein [Syntrophorhabdaceae bacterium]
MAGLKKGRSLFAIFFIVFLSFIVLCIHASAESKKKLEGYEQRPERSISMALEYTGLEISPGQAITMNLIFNNAGKKTETLKVWVSSKPEGWRVRLKSDLYTVTGVTVPWGEDKAITFEAEPGKNITPGDYKFVIEAKTDDEQFKMKESLLVKVREPDKTLYASKGIRLSASYPVLQGPSDSKFEFSIEAESKLDRDAVFNLSAQAPEGWEVNFKPAYEQKTISSLKLRANQSQNISVELTPVKDARAGRYPILIRASSGEAKAEITLFCILTGTYSIDAGTPTGLLSVDARQGKKSIVSVFVKNTGSAPLQNIKFLSFKPENWKVEFTPDTIQSLEPKEVKQVEVSIIPYEEALVGDYSIGIGIQSEKASKNLEFRVSVKASTAWGWIGAGIIIIVIAGLMLLFRWIGRR